MDTAPLSRGLLSRIEVSSEKKTTHFELNPPCRDGFNPVSIKIAKNEIWNSRGTFSC